MNAQTAELNAFPPISPTDEGPAPNDPSFVEMCLANSADVLAAGRWQLRAQLLTQSETWGTIWRADFTMPDGNVSPAVNRLVCWRGPGGKFTVMIAIGQSAPPL